MATPKSLRQPPARIFEHYTLTKIIAPGAGLTEVIDSQFQSISGSSALETNVSLGYEDDATSTLQPIGFNFEFDRVTYNRFTVSSNGWIGLADPLASSSLMVQSQLMTSASFQNEGAQLVNTSNSVLIAPWWDDLRNLASNISQLGLSSDLQSRMRYGYELPSNFYNEVAYAVKIFHDVKSPQGRRLIIRWRSLSDYATGNTILAFECVLYENGIIEFRYAPKQGLISNIATQNEDATIGIFARGTNRFRDFSYGLGINDQRRRGYKYGGAVYEASFTDAKEETYPSTHYVSRPYHWTLTPNVAWPGLDRQGAIFRFSPPQNRRKILPRNRIRERDSLSTLPTVVRTGNNRLGNSAIFFDDRRSASFISGVIVNYPTTLTRFIGDSEPGVTQRQDLFVGCDNDFELTGSIVKSAADQFLEQVQIDHLRPFGENLDQVVREDLFFASGSGFDTGERLDYPLWSKTQIKLSLPVDYTTLMFGTTASIYYYNNRSHSWVIPDNSTPTQGSDLSLADSFAANRRILEDHRGFGPIGNALGSGSNLPSSTGGTDAVINSPYNTTDSLAAISKEYAKSVFVNPEYSATSDETFKIPVVQPFLLEKAIFEIPFTFGPGWFNDRTQSFLPLISSLGAFDFAGPGITVALMNQIKIGDSTRRDLIMTGTITHVSDSISTLALSNFPTASSDFQIRPQGYLAYASAPGAIVYPTKYESSSPYFTGSVRIKSTAQVSNGVILKMSKDMVSEPSSSYPTNRIEVLNLIDKQELTLLSGTNEYSIGYNIAYVDPFGRAGTGFDPSGRSVYGKEFGTSQGIIFSGNKIRNPFYVSGTIREQISSSLASGNRFRAVAAIPLSAHFTSPYLVLPGDNLVLALAKSRPVCYSNGLGEPEFSGSSHDTSLLTGTINVTLYGSLLKENKEFHDTLNQNVSSDAIHEVLGAEPILDEFQLSYRNEYYGSFSDDYITGSLVSVSVAANRSSTLVTGSRGRVFSKLEARTKATPDTTPGETITNPSKAFRLQPWFERVGTPRINSNFIDNSERFWDTLLPGISDCFKVNGARIWTVVDDEFFGNSTKVVSSSIGHITFNAFLQSQLTSMTDNNWLLSYPYEPRYAGIPRQKNISKSFVATTRFNSQTNTLDTIEPQLLTGFYFGPMTIESSVSASTNIVWNFVADANLVATNSSGFYSTSSAGLDDTIKALYGFGDVNSIQNYFGNNYGTNHFPSFRNKDDYLAPDLTWVVRFSYSPIIRGWRYGVYNGLTQYNKATFRRNRFGHFRDMLEQRQFTKFFISPNDASRYRNDAVGTAVVEVKFVDSLGNITNAENTQSQNLSSEATSSFPYFDGEIRNRSPINGNTLNSSIISLNSDQFNNVTL